MHAVTLDIVLCVRAQTRKSTQFRLFSELNAASQRSALKFSFRSFQLFDPLSYAHMQLIAFKVDALCGQFNSPLPINLLVVQHLMHDFTLRCITRSEIKCEKRLTVKCCERCDPKHRLVKTESGRFDSVTSASLSHAEEKKNTKE